MISETEAVEAAEFHHGVCQLTYGPRGGERRSVEVWRRNGATQTWKTRPGYRVPVKYGMRSYGQITPDIALEFHVPGKCPLEFTEYREQRRDGLVVEVSKWGGGTLGKAYSDHQYWDVKVIGPQGRVLLDDKLTTNLPTDHKQAARLAVSHALSGEDN